MATVAESEPESADVAGGGGRNAAVDSHESGHGSEHAAVAMDLNMPAIDRPPCCLSDVYIHAGD